MRYQNLGTSGLSVSVVGLGCNNFGGRIDAGRDQARRRRRPRRRHHALRHRRHLRRRGRLGEFLGGRSGPQRTRRGRDQVRRRRSTMRYRGRLGAQGRPRYIRLRRRAVAAPAAAPTASTCTSCTSPTRRRRSRRRSTRSTSWSTRARCATSATRTSPASRSTTPRRPPRDQRLDAVRQRAERVLPARARCRARRRARRRAQLGLGFLPYFPLANGLLTGKVTRAGGIPDRHAAGRASPTSSPTSVSTVSRRSRAWARDHGHTCSSSRSAGCSPARRSRP